MNIVYSPILLFAFNRPDSLRNVINALKENPEANESDLFIFVDGPRDSNGKDSELVGRVREIAMNTTGFKSINHFFSEKNKGLGKSIIEGVSEVINKYGSAIVLEDDLIVMPNFLSFMNRTLAEYRDKKKVWSVCGYTNKINTHHGYAWDAYFAPRSSSWGWGTWADRWNSVNWSFDDWDSWNKMKSEFNRWGGSDCFSMLNDCRIGKNNSWAIRFCFNQFLQDKLSLFPIKSLVDNRGFDGNGTNCKRYSRFKFELMPETKKEFFLPEDIETDLNLTRQALFYHSIPLRIWSRLMYMIKR